MGTLFGIAIGIVLGGFVVAFIAGAKISERVAEAFEAGRKIGEAESELMARLGDCPEEVEAADTSFDMRQCKPGDRLISKHGTILIYVGLSGYPGYPHAVKYPVGADGTRTDDGHVFAHRRLPEDEDIVGFAPEPAPLDPSASQAAVIVAHGYASADDEERIEHLLRQTSAEAIARYERQFADMAANETRLSAALKEKTDEAATWKALAETWRGKANGAQPAPEPSEAKPGCGAATCDGCPAAQRVLMVGGGKFEHYDTACARGFKPAQSAPSGEGALSPELIAYYEQVAKDEYPEADKPEHWPSWKAMAEEMKRNWEGATETHIRERARADKFEAELRALRSQLDGKGKGR